MSIYHSEIFAADAKLLNSFQNFQKRTTRSKEEDFAETKPH